LIFRSILGILETLHHFRVVAGRTTFVLISHCCFYWYGIISCSCL